MLKLILSRLLQGVLVLLIISFLIFALLTRAGGDAVSMLNRSARSEETAENIRRINGLDRPLMERYLNWLADAARGDLGHSFVLQAPVGSLIWLPLLRTCVLATVALLIAWSLSLTLGIAAARRPGSLIDRLCSVIILLAASTPRLALALLALALISSTPLMPFIVATTNSGAEVLSFRVIPPAIILSVPLLAIFLSQTRVAIREALDDDLVRVARARGAPEWMILLRHALRPAAGPLITIFGLSLGGVMSGSVIVETVMGWPGLGQLTVSAVGTRDIPLLLGVTLAAAASVMAGNLAADILLRLNNPRLRNG
ncbi:MAG TPA: ABC transporter permease [Blastocatellia bacterium]|jgi:peptide/nickel transport system permease protein|nr:ABC transporter permease [Blastocatellia bacterium]